MRGAAAGAAVTAAANASPASQLTRGQVFLHLGFAPAEAEAVRIRAILLYQLVRHAKDDRLMHLRAARRFGVSRARVGDLMRGRVDLFTLDELLKMLSHAGLRPACRIAGG